MTTPLIARDGRLRAVVRAIRPSDRACGECGACCTALHVEELDKPAGQTCSSVRAGRGCATYRDRPTACREFQCLWLRGLRGTGTEHRPDRIGLMLTPTTEPRTIEARELWASAATTIDALFLLHALRESGLTVRIVPPPVVATQLTIAAT